MPHIEALPLGLITVYFFYGLSFFVFGLVILCVNDRKGDIKLSGIFWLLALFGILHGVNEWIDTFLLFGREQLGNQLMGILKNLALIVTAASFYFLLCFAIASLLLKYVKNSEKFIFIYLIILFFIFTIIVMPFLMNENNNLAISNSSILLRYFVGFPGALFTGLAFIYWKNQPGIKKLSSKWTATSFLGIAITFMLYAILTGFVVPKGTFFPANIINYETFTNIVGLPVQTFRMICAISAAIFIFGILNIFNVENSKCKTKAQLAAAYISLIQALSKPIELHVPYTENHHKKTAQLVKAIATKMQLTEEQGSCLSLISWIYDLGKLCISKEILTKPKEMLRPEDYKIIELYPLYGYELLKDLDQRLPCPVANIVLEHHEYLDGTGYPRGIKGEKISVEAKILNVADAVVSLISKRLYREAISVDEAIKEITKYKGKKYDPEVVDVCIKLFTKEGFKFDENEGSHGS